MGVASHRRRRYSWESLPRFGMIPESNEVRFGEDKVLIALPENSAGSLYFSKVQDGISEQVSNIDWASNPVKFVYRRVLRIELGQFFFVFEGAQGPQRTEY